MQEYFQKLDCFRSSNLGRYGLSTVTDKFPNYYVFIEKVDLENNEVQARWLEAFPDEGVDQRLVVDRTAECVASNG